MIRRQKKNRTGLAPLEFVLALPILLFVMALIVNYGTAAAWRVRGEIVSRDAVWGERHPRSAQTRPPSWPDDATYTVVADAPITLLDDPEIDHEVVRGPLGDIGVNPVLDPDRTGAVKGVSEIDRPFALLPTMGNYDSNEIAHRLLHPWWQCNDEGYPNWYRRSRILYEWPDVGGGLESSHNNARQALQQFHQANWDVLRTLDQADPDFIRYGRSPPQFHPSPRHMCETDPEVVRERAMERYMIDYVDSRGEVQLGRITQLPRTMTSAFLSLYRGRKQELENLIMTLQMVMPQTADIQRQINNAQNEIDNELNPKIAQLEAYQKRLDQIEDDLKANSPAKMP